MTSKDQKEDIIRRFAEECVWVRSIRDQYRGLYESGSRRRELLSEIANTFFGDLNIILQEYIILQMCKLTDPSQFGKDPNKKNLTTNLILGFDWPSEVKEILDKESEIISKFIAQIVAARNTAIAHADLKVYTGNLRLGGFEEKHEEEFWAALQRFVCAAHMATFGEPYEIESTVVGGDASSLIHALKEAMDYQDLVEGELGFLSKRFGKVRYEGA